jgi:serine/threonine-protein kinase RIM15
MAARVAVWPPFHDDTPEKVFENTISRKIERHDHLVEFSPEARDFMERLICTEPEKWLGCSCAQEVKDHPFFNSSTTRMLSLSPAGHPQ